MTDEYHEGVADGIHGAVHWNYGLPSELAYERVVNGHDRRATFVEIDGVRYHPRPERDWDEVCE